MMKRFSKHVRLILFLCTLSLLGLLTYRLPHLTAAGAMERVPVTGTELQILIPLYNYPNWYDPDNYIWDDVAAANSQVPITAIINPNNGPGGGPPNTDYQTGLDDLRDAGVTIVGYVYTTYGNRPASEVKADVDLYNQHFDIDGIFFDEAASSADELPYYQDLYDYVKARPNLDKVIINPGTDTNEGYISTPASDVAVIFEDNSTQWPGYDPSGYVANYPAERFAMLVHGVPDAATMQSHLDLVQDRNIGYVYLTNDIPDNPWDTLPSFWSEEVSYIQQLNQKPTPTPTSIPTSTPTSPPSPTRTPTNAPTSTNTPPNTPTSTNTPTNAPTSTNTPPNAPTSTNTPPVANTSTPTLTSGTSGEAELQILIPLYNYPNWYDPDNYIWDDVAAANSQVPITAIINPNNGPGGEPNTDYQTGLDELRDAGVTIVGYVYTTYGNRPASEVKADVDLYDQHFDIDGIFFDEAASGKLSYYQDLYNYVKARPNLLKVIINPGTHIDEDYISAPASDVAVIFEDNSSQWPDHKPDAYVANYPANRFAMLVHGASQASIESHIDKAIRCNIGYVYLTDDTFENNPWDSLPSFWSEEVAYIQQINKGLKSSATCTSGPSSENALYLPLVIR